MSRLLCVFSRIRQKGIKPMTENEKKLLQAKHRLEEAEMRDRQKERKARTRRLIQEGAADNTDDFGTVGGFFV